MLPDCKAARLFRPALGPIVRYVCRGMPRGYEISFNSIAIKLIKVRYNFALKPQLLKYTMQKCRFRDQECDVMTHLFF